MYAYTSSAVMRGVLDLFVRCEAVLPNLYIGTLTRYTSLSWDTVTALYAQLHGRCHAPMLASSCNVKQHPGHVCHIRSHRKPSITRQEISDHKCSN